MRERCSARQNHYGPDPEFLALYAKDLLQRVHDLDEVGLVGHHLVDVLVGTGDLVEHAAILAADDALGLRLEILRGERFLRGIDHLIEYGVSRPQREFEQ